MAIKRSTIILAILISLFLSPIMKVNNIQANGNFIQSGSSKASCINPQTEAQQAACRQIEVRILESTVRIEMRGWHLTGGHRLPLINGGKSHATIVTGYYLVTHNHFMFPLTEPAAEDGEGYTGISLRRMDGSLILENAPLSSINIIHKEGQTMVLEIVDQNGDNLLEGLGLPTAQIVDWKRVTWEEGMELAQIDWDGENTHIDWVLVEAVIMEGADPYLQVNDYALKGSSGGGVFLDGLHLGNVWAHNVMKDPDTGEVTRRYTMIALNQFIN